jgi:hypothetical protein
MSTENLDKICHIVSHTSTKAQNHIYVTGPITQINLTIRKSPDF